MRAAILASVCVWRCRVAGSPSPVHARRRTREFAPQPQLARQTPPPLQAPRQAPLEPDALAALTDISAIRALTPEAANSRRRARIRGTITYINEREPAGIIVHDGEAGLFVHYGDYFVEEPPVTFRPGDIVEVDGYTTGHGFAPAIVPDDVQAGGAGTAAGSRNRCRTRRC